MDLHVGVKRFLHREVCFIRFMNQEILLQKNQFSQCFLMNEVFYKYMNGKTEEQILCSKSDFFFLTDLEI